MESGDTSLPDTARTDVLKFHVESRIKHRYARTVITSIVANNADHAQEVLFNITLPESAFISAFQMEIDGKVYKAHVNGKEEAKQEYAHAVSRGLSAAHVEQSVRDSSKFNVSVNVEKKQTVTFKLTYEELLKRELSAYKHVINIDPGQIVPELLVEVYIDESDKLSLLEVSPLQEKSEMQLNSSDEVNTLAKIERPKPNEGIVRWSPSIGDQKKLGANGVKGQLVVRYDVDRKSKPEQILVNNGYFVHFFAPTDLPVLRKHVVFVLDVSGSMDGRKIEQLKDAMKTILNDIGSDDFFSLIIFSTDVLVWDPDVEPLPQAEMERMFARCSDSPPVEKLPEAVVVPATVSNIEKAKLFVSSLDAYSATNIHGALLKAIEVAHLGKKLHHSKKISGVRPEPMIIFLTDGQPNEGERHPDKITSITTAANKDTRAVLFSLAFGDDADMGFLKKLSLQNSGFARKIYEAADAALQLNHFYHLVSSPLLANVKFKYEDKEVVPGSVTNTNFRTLFGGSELVIAGRLCSDTISGEMVSDSCGVEKCSCICKPTVMPKKEYEFMERLWAFLTIKQLLDNVTADADVAENKKQALELALKYSFVTPLTSLVVVKPDQLAEETNVETDDVTKFHDSRILLKKKIKKSIAIPCSDVCNSASDYDSGESSSEIVLCSAHTGRIPLSANIRYRRSMPANDDDSDDDSDDDDDDSDDDDSDDDADQGIVNCKISSLHIESNIWCRYASTIMEQVFENSGITTEEINFNIYLTWSAVISHCSISDNGNVKTLHLLSTEDGEENFATSKGANKAAVLVRPSTSDGQRGVTVCLVLPPRVTLTFKFQYEEFLEDFGDGYMCTLSLKTWRVVPDVKITVNVEGFYKLADVRALNIVPFSPKEEVLEQVEVKYSPADGHKKAVLSWSPSVEEQKRLFGSDHSMQLGIEYKVHEPSFGSDGPVGEVVLDESGQTIHVFLPSAVAAEAAKRHLILLLHVGATATTEMRDQITAAARNLLLKLQKKYLFSIIICSNDIQVWEDSGSVLSGATTLGTDRFPASQANITKARDFITQALATVPRKDPSVEAALAKALEVSSQAEEAQPKIFVLSTGGTSIAEAELHNIATRLKKANTHQVAIFSLACGSAPLLTLFRDVSADSSGFACELHKQTVERLLDLFFRISQFDRINCKVVSQLPVLDGFMERFWLKEAIEQSTEDNKIELSLSHNLATSETSFYAASEL